MTAWKNSAQSGDMQTSGWAGTDRRTGTDAPGKREREEGAASTIKFV